MEQQRVITIKRKALDVFAFQVATFTVPVTPESKASDQNHTFILNKKEVEDLVRKGLSTLAAMPEEYCTTVEQIDGIKR